MKAIKRSATKPLNVHLMIVEPERSLDRYRDAVADHLLVRAGTALFGTGDYARAIADIRAAA